MNEIGQIIVELLLQILAEVLTDAVGRRLPDPGRLMVKVLLVVLISILLGWFSVALFPRSFIAIIGLRVTYLLVVPLLIGALMSWIGKQFTKRGRPLSTLESFGHGWLFAFSFALTRYLLTS